MKFKNANIQSREEARRRLCSGEIFFAGSGVATHRIYFDESYLWKGESQFRCYNEHCGNEGVFQLWESVDTWEIAISWEDMLDGKTPILCAVWNGYDNSDSQLRKIVHKMSEGENFGGPSQDVYFDIDGDRWEYAVAISASECWDYDE